MLNKMYLPWASDGIILHSLWIYDQICNTLFLIMWRRDTKRWNITIQPLVPKCQLDLHVIHPIVTNEDLMIELWHYNPYIWCWGNATIKILVKLRVYFINFKLICLVCSWDTLNTLITHCSQSHFKIQVSTQLLDHYKVLKKFKRYR